MMDRPASPIAMSDREFYSATFIIWLLVWSFLIVIAWDRVSSGSLGDPDNYMRLVQVRDWLNGQAWADLKQHRMNPPLGGDLHWSRLVDMPIALIIMALRPLFGQPMAEIAALIAVPALLYLTLMLVMARLLRDIAGPGIALALIALMPCCLLINTQFMPMRIDHHGWQLLMAGVALLAWTRPGRAAVVACGVACAFWMHVSIEGLPYALIFAGLYAVAYIQSGERRFHVFIGTLSVATLFFLLMTRGPLLLFETYCDAISAPYLAAMLVALAAFLLIDHVMRPTSMAARLVSLIIAGLGGIAALALVASRCLGGPFATLDPETREFWYYSVKEGLPFWHQSAPFAFMVVLAPLPGVIWAVVVARKGWGTANGLKAVGLALAAFLAWLLGLAVMRSGGVAQLYALPGMAALIATLAASRDRFRPRIGWSLSMAGAFMLATALPAYVLGSLTLGKGDQHSKDDDKLTYNCSNHLSELGVLSKNVLFAPIDQGPLILYHTDLSIIGAAYHRNSAAIATVIRAFMAAPQEARAIVLATSADYLLLCPTSAEIKNYLRNAPHGLASELAKGNVPSWLEPDPRIQQPGARLYRIIR